MGSNGREIEKEQLDNYYAESTVFVAVGKNVKESESVLSWAIGKFAGKKRICILHIHQPGQLVTFFDGKFTTSKFKQRAIKVFHNSDMQKLQKLLSEYVHYVAQMGFRADRMWIEVENIENGIVSLIAQHGIKWLVMGAAADKHFTKEKAELKSQKAKFVYEQAPASCCIWFTCRGELILTRKGTRNHSGIDIFRATESQNTNSITEGMDDIRLGAAGAEDSSGPLGTNVATEEAEYSEVESLAQDALSSNPDISIEEEENLIVEAPAEDVHSSSSRVSTEESESESFESESESESESELESMTEEAEFDNTNNTPVDTPLLESNMVPDESRLVRTDLKADEKGSPQRLTVRERGSILRAYSVDLSSVEEKSMVLSTSLDCLDRAKQDHGFEENSQMIEYRSSFSSVMSKDRMTGKAKLEAPREVYKKLNQATLDAENTKHEAFRELVDRRKAEENAMNANRKADAIESKYIKEMKRREAVEEALEEHEREYERMKEENEKMMEELPMVQDHCSGLANQIRESEAAAKELEEKIVSAVDLLISFRAKRDQLEKERDDAIQELGKLKRLKQRRIVALSGLQFSTFSLLEIDEATCSFDPSRRIGDGRYGGVYRGILRHIDVSIRMLPNDGFLSQKMFERGVEILSRIRHPNIVKLIGFCPEVRSIAYEYLERGNLEDHLAGTGKTHSLPWQTRVRIAAELCSALIFVHSNNPQILHGNLRPTKVLLDANFVSKIGDLGIFFLISQHQLPNSQHASSEYIDPEFLETGVLTQYTDIYSFGIILLRILTGRPASRILRDVKLALKNDKLGSILDVSAGDWPISQAKALARIALRCCVRDLSKRPDLASDIWSVLEPFRQLSIAQPSCLQKKENKRPPSHFLCPIFKDIMEDPCTAADGYTYEGDAIRGWIDSGHVTSPMTNLKLSNCDLIPNHALQYAIQEWLHRP